MFAAKSIFFHLLLIFVASPHISSSTRVNKTVSDGKVFITGDHNEVVMSPARETKLELAEIKNKLKLLSEGNDVLTRNLKALDQRIFGRECAEQNNRGHWNEPGVSEKVECRFVQVDSRHEIEANRLGETR